MNEFWKEDQSMKNDGIKLSVSQELSEKLNKNLILETDICSVIDSCEQTGKKLFNPETDTFTGYLQIGNMTYWAEYRVKQESGYELVNAYCHRMKVEE